MAYDWLDLREDEEVRLKTHPSNWLMVKRVLLFVVVTVVVGYLSQSGILPDDEVVGFGLEILVLVAIPLALLPVVADWFKRRFTVYVVTTDQVWKKTGVFNRSIDPLALEEIVDIEIHQSGLERFMKKGEVVIANAGAGDQAMHMTHAPKPNKVASEIRRAKSERESDSE